ncbi:DUF192 domain-containing protein [Mesobacillus boroniphilus]|uniref:DUF192 domain-containing protein n=1 Tax=Mesobacillus boroniphilus TaxID=308892 RepID=A0A944CPM0_9BACI|nr:DUF192 domain-containing protein [Mesobacillus boroniphilus]MBS8266576.1 DUF192 domain-containing protein [Mesobacillus boroniphilus]
MKTIPKKSLPYRIKIANTFSARLKGLMFRRSPLDRQGLWITPCNSIHMFFMNFPIDAVFLDKEVRIVKLVGDLDPWKIVKPIPNAYSVVELPVGTIKKFDLQTGDILELNVKETVSA